MLHIFHIQIFFHSSCSNSFPWLHYQLRLVACIMVTWSSHKGSFGWGRGKHRRKRSLGKGMINNARKRRNYLLPKKEISRFMCKGMSERYFLICLGSWYKKESRATILWVNEIRKLNCDNVCFYHKRKKNIGFKICLQRSWVKLALFSWIVMKEKGMQAKKTLFLTSFTIFIGLECDSSITL